MPVFQAKVTVDELSVDPAAGLVMTALGVWVVTLNAPLTPPMVRVAVVRVEKLAEDVRRSVTVLPFITVPATEV